MDNAASFFFSSGFSNKFWKREGFPVRLNTMMHVHDKQSYFIVNSGTSRFKKRCWTELVFSVFRRVGARVRRACEARVRHAWEARVRCARGEYTKGKSGASEGVAIPPMLPHSRIRLSRSLRAFRKLSSRLPPLAWNTKKTDVSSAVSNKEMNRTRKPSSLNLPLAQQ